MKDLNQALFSQYARHYDSMARRERLPEDLEKLKRDRLPPWLSEIPRDARILDLGCAQGHLLEALRRVGYTRLTGVDLSSELLSSARRLLPETVRLIQADLCEWLKEEPDESFDVVFLHDVLEHLPRESVVDVLRDIRRVLAPGGRLSVRVPNLAGLSGVFLMASDFTHVTPFTEISLFQVLEASGFDPHRIVLQSQAPRLFWSWHTPHRALFRLANRVRWHLNNFIHQGIYLLSDIVVPQVSDPALVMVARK